jgi:hypothetical protein
VLVGLVLALTVAAGPARAQYPVNSRGVPGYTSPPVSPYINLLRSGSNPAINYYGLVRPQFQFQNSITGLQQQVTTLDQTQAEAEAGVLPSTGHPVQFFNYSHYYSTSLPRSVVTRTGGMQGAGLATSSAKSSARATARPTIPR